MIIWSIHQEVIKMPNVHVPSNIREGKLRELLGVTDKSTIMLEILNPSLSDKKVKISKYTNNTIITWPSDISRSLYSARYFFQDHKEYSPIKIGNYFRLNDNENNLSEFTGCNESIKRKSISLNVSSRKEGLK